MSPNEFQDIVREETELQQRMLGLAATSPLGIGAALAGQGIRVPITLKEALQSPTAPVFVLVLGEAIGIDASSVAGPDSGLPMPQLEIVTIRSRVSPRVMLPIFTSPATAGIAQTLVPGFGKYSQLMVDGASIVPAIDEDTILVANPWSWQQWVDSSELIAEFDEVVRGEQTFGDEVIHTRRISVQELSAFSSLGRLEITIEMQRTSPDPVPAIREKVAETNIYALGHAAGEVTTHGGTEADLLHFTIDDEHGVERVMLPVFTRPNFLREALLRNPDWQTLMVLVVDGAGLIAHIEDDVTLVINPWSSLEFQVPSREMSRAK